MLAVLIRNRDAFSLVCTRLHPQHVTSALGRVYGLLWKNVVQFVEAHDYLPGKSLLVNALSAAVHQNGEGLTAEEMDEVCAWLDFAYDDELHGEPLSRSRVHADIAVATCRQLLEELIADEASAKLSGQADVPADLAAVLDRFQQRVEEARSLTMGKASPLFAEGWEREQTPDFRSSGIAMLDRFLGGGFVPGEVVCFMAPYGSCKTLVTTQAAVNFALAAARASESGCRQVAVLVSTEMTQREARIRLLCCAARIPLKRLLRLRSLDELDGGDRPAATPQTRYEQRLFAPDQPFVNERQRVRTAQQLLNEHLLFLDCTGTSANDQLRLMGTGGIPEIAATLQAEMRRCNHAWKPNFLVLDHASGLVSRMMEGNNAMRSEDVRIVLEHMPRQARSMLAGRFNIPVLITHQLSGAANARAPAAHVDHTDAAGCKSFGQFFDFTIEVGNLTADKLRLGVARCTKHRREPPRSEMVIRVDGRFQRVLDASRHYTVDHNRRAIVPRSDLEGRGQAWSIRMASAWSANGNHTRS